MKQLRPSSEIDPPVSLNQCVLPRAISISITEVDETGNQRPVRSVNSCSTFA